MKDELLCLRLPDGIGDETIGSAVADDCKPYLWYAEALWCSFEGVCICEDFVIDV